MSLLLKVDEILELGVGQELNVVVMELARSIILVCFLKLILSLN